MTKTTVHIINHTHWDREWFLTAIYTTEWIPKLIDRLEELVENNPDFHYLLDGQTLIVEDLLNIRPDYEARVRKLVSSGNLQIGPYYCQPDWQLTGGETLFRNLEYGLEIVNKFGGTASVGWMVDTFGHLSQSPQIHQKFGINTVYVWRGVPELKPYFEWEGTGGYKLFAINLFGGYRNLYGVTHAPTVAERRLQQEADQLAEYYPTADIPLFDGYDLEDNPEDPVQWLQQRGAIASHLELVEATPDSFSQTIQSKLEELPKICGELNSGKFGATFPGTFSTRTYLKILGHDCEQLLYQVVEPLAAMAFVSGEPWDEKQYQQWSKVILQNAVHDAICGVSIDQVHERMEYSYRQIFGKMTAEIERLLPIVFSGFASGRYWLSTAAIPLNKWVVCNDQLYHLQTKGLGIQPVSKGQLITKTKESISYFSWGNEHYEAQLNKNGVLKIGEARFGQIQVSAEHGDTYSGETGDILGTITPDSQGLVLEATAEGYAVVLMSGRLKIENGEIAVQVRYSFDASPIIGVAIELDSTGSNFHAEMIFETVNEGDIWVGMPFDRVKRGVIDDDLMARNVEGEIGKILMGQRELNETRTFPMHDFVGRSDGEQSTIIFSKGNRSYRSWEDGKIAISLRRSVEWVTAADLKNRVGDAGPFFYVPDARCERGVKHELGIYAGRISPEDVEFNQLSDSFHQTPLLVDIKGAGDQSSWHLYDSDQPISAVFPDGEKIVGRQWHATGDQQGAIEVIDLFEQKAELLSQPSPVTCNLLNWPSIRISHNHGSPQAKILNQLKENIEQLAQKVSEAEAQMAMAEGIEKLRAEHKFYVYQRELFEFRLSLRLNELKIQQKGVLTHAYLYEPDEEVAEIGYKLNQLRIKRRIFDYVVSVI